MRPLQKDPLAFNLQNWREYGDYVYVRILPGFGMYTLTDPSAIEHVLVKNHKNYRKPDFFNSTVKLLAGNGILVSEGDFWLRQKEATGPPMIRRSRYRISVAIRQSTWFRSFWRAGWWKLKSHDFSYDGRMLRRGAASHRRWRPR